MAEAAEGLELSGDASLKKILNNTIATIEDNKSQLFDIYESVRTEVEAAKKQLEDLKFQVRQTIERVDALEKQEQQEKQKLALASKNFAQEEDSEARMKERYDAVKNVQVALAVERDKSHGDAAAGRASRARHRLGAELSLDAGLGRRLAD